MQSQLAVPLLLDMYRRMWLIRRFDDVASELHTGGEIPGGMHTTQGQEGEVVGACLALRRDDYMVGNHRSHGHPIAKGASIAPLMAELFAKRTGVCRGKGGSMHLADFSVGSLGETSIVGSGLPIATGAALAAKMAKTDRVSMCFFGDGASNQGVFHESMNLAAVWQLPVIFLCENNQYAMSTPASQMIAVRDIAERAKGHGIPGMVVDGQDVIAVYREVSTAVQRARSGAGPTLIEAKTYRWVEHAINLGREFSYRTREEIEAWRARDPIELLRVRLLEEYGIAAADLDSIRREVEDEIAAAVTFARTGEFPSLNEAFTDVYATGA
jgi:acetoin:2,6-dichlorophenolindophenol oxidoreductase subunit alpha